MIHHLELGLDLGAGLGLRGPVGNHAPEEGRIAGALYGGDVEVRKLKRGRSHGHDERLTAEAGFLGSDGQKLLVEIRRHDVAAGGSGGFAQGSLGLLAPLVELACINLLQPVHGGAAGRGGGLPRIADGCLQEPVAEIALGVAFAAGAEEGGYGVLATQGLGSCNLLDGLGDLVVERLGKRLQRQGQLLFDELANRVALHGLGDALVDEGFGLLLVGNVNALADGFAEVGLFELNEHRKISRRCSEGVRVHASSVHLQAPQGGGLVSVSPGGP